MALVVEIEIYVLVAVGLLGQNYCTKSLIARSFILASYKHQWILKTTKFSIL